MGWFLYGDPWGSFAGGVAPVLAQYTDQRGCRIVWSHRTIQDEISDDDHVFDMIPRIAPTPGFQQKPRVKNPMRLDWAE